MRIILATLVSLSTLTAASAKDFRTYPGFINPKAFVQMINDRGLTVEITLRCAAKGRKKVDGMMVYSKIEKVYCSSKWLCTKDAQTAADDTCGY